MPNYGNQLICFPSYELSLCFSVLNARHSSNPACLKNSVWCYLVATFESGFLKTTACWSCMTAWGWEVWAWAAIWRDHWWCILSNTLLTTPNPSFPLSCPLLEGKMKGPPLLVVQERQIPWIDVWLIIHASPLFACLAPTYTTMIVAACNQLLNWILLVNIHSGIGLSLPNNVPLTTVRLVVEWLLVIICSV